VADLCIYIYIHMSDRVTQHGQPGSRPCESRIHMRITHRLRGKQPRPTHYIHSSNNNLNNYNNNNQNGNIYNHLDDDQVDPLDFLDEDPVFDCARSPSLNSLHAESCASNLTIDHQQAERKEKKKIYIYIYIYILYITLIVYPIVRLIPMVRCALIIGANTNKQILNVRKAKAKAHGSPIPLNIYPLYIWILGSQRSE